MRKAFVFDLDGTLVDTKEVIICALNECIKKKNGVPPPLDELAREFQGSPRQILRKRGITSLDLYWRLHSQYCEKSRLFFSSTGEVLDQLARGGAKLSVLTSLPAEPARALLRIHNLENRFILLDTYGSRFPLKKPNPKVLLAHLADIEQVPETAAYVGDTQGDITMAKEAGVLAVGAAWGPGGKAELESAGAQIILTSFETLLELP